MSNDWQPTSYGQDMNQTGPPGLEYLASLDQVLVKQKKELCEIFSGCEMNNKYLVKNSMGQEFMTAREDTDCCTRQCCGPIRCFELGLFNSQEQEVIRLTRPLKCASCWCPCCLQVMEVSSPPGNPLGSIQQEWSICTPFNGRYVVRDHSGDEVFQIQAPWCPCSCGGDVNFKITSMDGSKEVGRIYKQWQGCCTETFTDADSFGISFSIDTDVRNKALLMGALFLIDFIYFERSN